MVVSEGALNKPAKAVASVSLSYPNPRSVEERGSGQAVSVVAVWKVAVTVPWRLMRD